MGFLYPGDAPADTGDDGIDIACGDGVHLDALAAVSDCSITFKKSPRNPDTCGPNTLSALIRHLKDCNPLIGKNPDEFFEVPIRIRALYMLQNEIRIYEVDRAARNEIQVILLVKHELASR